MFSESWRSMLHRLSGSGRVGDACSVGVGELEVPTAEAVGELRVSVQGELKVDV